MARKIELEITGDTRNLERALSRASGKTKTTMQKMSKAAGYAGLALGGGLAIAAKIGFDELAEGQKVTAQTNAVLESTGGIANVTAGHVDDLASSLSKMSGVDDEAIASGENLLLTFKNVRNEVGKGNDIFDQATEAALDMSVALDTDMSDASMNVGKALNDPIKGVSRLTRLGVTFTDKQKKLIEQLVATGDVAGAQKIILQELQDEFGGSAKAAGETLPGKLSKLRNSFDETAGKLMESMLPALEKVMEGLTKVADWAQKNPEKIQVMVGVLGALAAAFMLVSVASTIATIAASPWIAIGVGVAAVIIGIGVAAVIAYKKFETFRNIVDGVVRFVKEHWKTLLALIPVIGPLLAVVITKFKLIKSTASTVFGAVRTSVQWVIDKISVLVGWVQTLVDWIGRIDFPSMPDRGGGVPFIPGIATGGDIARSGMAVVHKGERVVPARVVNRGGGSGGSRGSFVVLGDQQFVSWLRGLDGNERRRNGGRGIL